MHEKNVKRAYRRELGGSMLVYMLLLFPAIRFGRPMDEGVLRTVILASPIIGFLLMIWALARHLRRIDEYVRQMTLETLAIAAGITASVTFSYGFLETAGYPKLSMFVVWGVMGVSWALAAGLRHLIKR